VSSLIDRLSNGKHRVKIDPRIEDMMFIKKRIEDGFVFIKFMETNGGTELGVILDHSKSNFETADFSTALGTINLTGTCTLDGVKVRCYAEIELNTKEGKGCIEIITYG
jgi:hypothetical protein